MKNRALLITVLSVLVILVLAACASSPTQAPTTGSNSPTTSGTSSSLDGAAIMQNSCTQCHGLSAIYNTQTDAAGWTTIVDNMIQRGAQLTPDQRTALIAYLAANY